MVAGGNAVMQPPNLQMISSWRRPAIATHSTPTLSKNLRCTSKLKDTKRHVRARPHQERWSPFPQTRHYSCPVPLPLDPPRPPRSHLVRRERPDSLLATALTRAGGHIR